MAIKPMYAGRVNSPPTTLAKAISATDTTIEVADGSVLPNGPNYVTIGTNDAAETIIYTTKTGNILSGVTRNVESGYGARAWLMGEIIGRNFTNKDHQNLIDNITSLNDDKLDKTSIADNLTTDSATQGLSARQGKVLDKTKTKRVDLSGQLQLGGNFQHSVIALCELTNTYINATSFSNGVIIFSRDNGLYQGIRIDAVMQKKYNSENAWCDYKITGETYVKIKPCKFRYNGIPYGGLDIYISPANFKLIEFNGVTNFPIFGLDYYNAQTSTPINQEVYDSLTYDGIEQGGVFEFNGKSVLTEGMDIIPDVADTRSLGSAALPFKGVYSKEVSSLITKDFYVGKTPSFTNGTANEKVDIIFGKQPISGTFSIRLVGSNSWGNIIGLLERTYSADLLANGTESPTFQRSSAYTFLSSTRNLVALSDIKWNDTIGWHVTIAKATASTNLYNLSVRITQTAINLLKPETITFGNIYTTGQ